jgi:hypothetical protein
MDKHKIVKTVPVDQPAARRSHLAQLSIGGHTLPLDVVTVISSKEVETDLSFVQSRIKSANSFLKARAIEKQRQKSRNE